MRFNEQLQLGPFIREKIRRDLINQDASYLSHEHTRINGQFVRDQYKSRLK